MARLVLLLFATCLAPALGKRKRVNEGQSGVAPEVTLSVVEHVAAIENRKFLKNMEYKGTFDGHALNVEGELPEGFDTNRPDEVDVIKEIEGNATGKGDETPLVDAFETRNNGAEVMAKLCGRCCCDMHSTKSWFHDTVKRSDRCTIFYPSISRDTEFAKVKCGSFDKQSWSSGKPMHNFEGSKTQQKDGESETRLHEGKCMVTQAELDDMEKLIKFIDDAEDPFPVGTPFNHDQCRRKRELIHG